MPETSLRTGQSRSRGSLRPLAGLAILTSVAIFFQALTAGQFLSPDGNDSWITVHGVIADVAWVLALVTAGYAWRSVRGSRPRLAYWSSALFVITLAQTGLGHLITDDGHDWLIAIHVPLAFVIFGLTTWITAQAITLARRVPR